MRFWQYKSRERGKETNPRKEWVKVSAVNEERETPPPKTWMIQELLFPSIQDSENGSKEERMEWEKIWGENLQRKKGKEWVKCNHHQPGSTFRDQEEFLSFFLFHSLVLKVNTGLFDERKQPVCVWSNLPRFFSCFNLFAGSSYLSSLVSTNTWSAIF